MVAFLLPRYHRFTQQILDLVGLKSCTKLANNRITITCLMPIGFCLPFQYSPTTGIFLIIRFSLPWKQNFVYTVVTIWVARNKLDLIERPILSQNKWLG